MGGGDTKQGVKSPGAGGGGVLATANNIKVHLSTCVESQRLAAMSGVMTCYYVD